MRKNSFLSQQVNFIVSVVFLGAFALFNIVTIIEAAEMKNPIASALAYTMVEEEERPFLSY